MVPEYGTIHPKAREKSQVPPGRGARRRQRVWSRVAMEEVGCTGLIEPERGRAIFGHARVLGQGPAIRRRGREPRLGHFVEQLVGLMVWLVANGVYLDMRRRGRRSFVRVLAFLMGLPATWITLLVVRPGTQPDIVPPADDEDALFREVRRDRALREGGAADGGPDARELPPTPSDEHPEQERE